MKLLLDIEEAQMDFMLDLLSKFDFVKIDIDAEELTDNEKIFVENRLLHHHAHIDKAVRWEDLKSQLEQAL